MASRTARAMAPAAILLVPGAMRRWWCMAVLAVAACGPMRELPPQALAPVADDGLPESALAHPRTVAWARRYCAKLETRAPEQLGLVPSRPLGPRLEAILAAHGLPRELVAVPAVESGYQTTARGDHGELGLWQLRPATARRFGLEVNGRHDERVHVDHSTRAAARYLQFLYARYGDWPLALAAYNAGEGRVDRALARRPGATFWELAERGALPSISCDYVPKILAVVRLHTEPGACGDTMARRAERSSGA